MFSRDTKFNNFLSKDKKYEHSNEVKVQLFWEGHKNLRNLPHGLDIGHFCGLLRKAELYNGVKGRYDQYRLFLISGQSWPQRGESFSKGAFLISSINTYFHEIFMKHSLQYSIKFEEISLEKTSVWKQEFSSRMAFAQCVSRVQDTNKILHQWIHCKYTYLTVNIIRHFDNFKWILGLF